MATIQGSFVLPKENLIKPHSFIKFDLTPFKVNKENLIFYLKKYGANCSLNSNTNEITIYQSSPTSSFELHCN